MNIINVPIKHELFEKEFEVDITNFIYDDFALIITDREFVLFGIQIFYAEKLEDMDFFLTVLNDAPLTKTVLYKIKDVSDSGEIIVLTSDEKYKEFGQGLVNICLRVISYIMYMQEKRGKIEKVSETKNREENEKNKRKKKKRNKIFLLEDYINYVQIEQKRGNERKIQCPCWNVRGHYRHYKSGKTIFVKDYRKGKYRKTQEPSDKEYYV